MVVKFSSISICLPQIGDTSFQSPIDTFNASLVQVKQQLGFRPDQNGASASPASTKLSQLPSESTLASLRRERSSAGSEIRIGPRTLPFPSPQQYQIYLSFFFSDINACHPCVNEGDLRARSERMMACSHLDRRESCFLALHFIIFACAEILQEFSAPEEPRSSPGWIWYNAADELIGRTKFNGHGDLSLVQFLIFEAFYLTHEDKPNAAYNISGLACRLCFQFGLHQQSRWEERNDSYQAHMKQRILWTAYFVDRRIALSCGRPYGMNDRDVDVDLPSWIGDREIRPEQPLPQVNNLQESFMPYLSCMVAFAKFSGEIWDQMFSAGASKTVTDAEQIAVLDTKIRVWSENSLPAIPLLPPNSHPLRRHLRQHILIHTRVSHLRLLLRRRLMVSLSYSPQDGRLCGDLAIDIVRQITLHSDEASQPSSFRFHMAVSLGGALLTLGTLLCRPLTELGLQDLYPTYADAFQQGLALLKELASGLYAARRMLLDLKDIIHVVETIINQPMAAPQQPQMNMPANIDNLFPYGAVDFAQQGGYPYETYHPGNLPQQIGYNNNFERSWHEWDGTEGQMQAQPQGYGAPWI